MPSLPSGSSRAGGQRGNQHFNKEIKGHEEGRPTATKEPPPPPAERQERRERLRCRGAVHRAWGRCQWAGGWGPGASAGLPPPPESHPGGVAASLGEPRDECPPKAGQHQSPLFCGEEQSRAPTMNDLSDTQIAACDPGRAARRAAPLRREKAGRSQRAKRTASLLEQNPGVGAWSALGRGVRAGAPPPAPVPSLRTIIARVVILS